MNDLSPRDRELVALGAALGSNCVPCIEYHIPEARKAGLPDEQIRAAIQHADRIRQVPARKVLQAALNRLRSVTEGGAAGAASGCGSEREARTPDPAGAAHPGDLMNEMMSKMKAACGASPSAGSSRAPSGAVGAPAADEGCGCR